MESDVAHELFLGLRVYYIPIRLNSPHPTDRASCCFHARCENPEIHSHFKCDICIFSHRYDKEFNIWLAHKRMIGEISAEL